GAGGLERSRRDQVAQRARRQDHHRDVEILNQRGSAGELGVGVAGQPAAAAAAEGRSRHSVRTFLMLQARNKYFRARASRRPCGAWPGALMNFRCRTTSTSSLTMSFPSQEAVRVRPVFFPYPTTVKTEKTEKTLSGLHFSRPTQ